MHFSGKVFWVTGASSGIGRAVALRLAAEGARLILTARNANALADVQQLCKAAGGETAVLPADLSDASLHGALVGEALSIFGGLDGIIHSAGVTQRSLFEETEMDVHRRLMEINFFAPLSITKLLLPHFRTCPKSHVVVLSSMAGLMGFPQRTGYAAAKHALKGAFETLQSEHTVPGLNILIVSPGRIRTSISLHALTAGGAPHGTMDKGQQEGIPADVCAKKILRAMMRGRRHLIIARSERILWWLWWWARPLYYRIARKAGAQPLS